MRAGRLLVLCLGALLGACVASAPSPPITAGPAFVENHVDSRRLLGTLRQRGIPLVARDPSKIEWLSDAHGYAYQIDQEWLHLHVYNDARTAAAARDRVVTQGRSRTSIIDWVGQPHAFSCGAVAGMFLGSNPVVLGIIADQCGSVTPLRD